MMAQWTSPSGAAPVGAHREDLSDIIYNVSPSETPCISAIGSASAKAISHDWPRDNLTAPTGTNAQSEGVSFAALAAAGAVAATPAVVRLTNVCQITSLGVDVSGTAEVIGKAGRDSQMAYQTAKKLRELKTNVDMAITGVNVAKTTVDPRKSGSLSTWMTANATSGRGVGGVDPVGADGSATATDGTTRAFAQSQLDDAVETVWNRSGRVPKIVLLGATQKRAFSMFDGVGNKGTFPGAAAADNVTRSDRAEGVIYASADVYMSNFGRLMAVPTRHIRKTATFDREVYLIEPEYLKLATLRPWQQFDIAVNGDSRQRQLLVEWCLEVSSQDPHIVIADLKNQT